MKSILSFLFLACILVPSPALAVPVQVTVSVLPQAYFVRQIAGDLANVSVMVAPGASPATYEPRPEQMVALSSSALYCAIGVPFERVWLPRISAAHPAMRVVRTQEGITKVPMAHHHHGKTSGQTILDPHIWLAPELVKIQARHICDGLAAVDPAHEGTYRARLAAFLTELTDLDTTIRTLLGPDARGKRFLIFHPAWGYFARAYGLIQVPVEMEGKAPTPAALAHLMDQARADHITTIFVQPQFSQKNASVIARGIHGKVVPLDPLAPDWADNLLSATRSIQGALR